MTKSPVQSLKLQLEEAIQMLRLVANEERTCVEVREWLERYYPEDNECENKNIVDMLMKSGSNNDYD